MNKLRNCSITPFPSFRRKPKPRPSVGLDLLDNGESRCDERRETCVVGKLLLSTFFIFLLSCSQKKQGGETQASSQKQQTGTIQESSQPTYFQSEQYPLRIDYLPGLQFTTKVRRNNRGERSYDPFAYTYDWVYLEVDASHEFSNDEQVDPGESISIISLKFYPTLQDFKDFLAGSCNPKEPCQIDEDSAVTFGNIPALQEKGNPSGHPLLTPGIYSHLVIMGGNIKKFNPSEISQAYSDRVADITHQMLQRIQWLKSIDSNSQEFKAWKQHILDLIKEANKAENK